MRAITGFVFRERHRDCFEAYKAIKFYYGLYGKEQVKVLNLSNQFGQEYTEVYIKTEATPIRKVNAMFGSVMNFIDEKGLITGDRILISKEK